MASQLQQVKGSGFRVQSSPTNQKQGGFNSGVIGQSNTTLILGSNKNNQSQSQFRQKSIISKLYQTGQNEEKFQLAQ